MISFCVNRKLAVLLGMWGWLWDASWECDWIMWVGKLRLVKFEDLKNV